MSMTQTTSEITPSDDPHCPHCNAALPLNAQFCATCGERLNQQQTHALLQDDIDIATRYRITSLVRRRPYVSLFFAIDNQQQRQVAIRDIDMTTLNEEERTQAAQAVQDEYDLLRRESISSLMPVIDLRHFQDHLYVVAGWPNAGNDKTGRKQLHTLQDVLQSGIGLPDIALALSWVERLCAVLERLHRHKIVLCDLDPQAIVLGGNSYSSGCALMVSWLPDSFHKLFPLNTLIGSPTNFNAPEVLLGKPEQRSDLYSLGAVLYLLLTGVSPESATVRTQHHLRPPSEANSRIGGALDEFVMQALALESSERFQNAHAMAEALLPLRPAAPKRPSPPPSPQKTETRKGENTKGREQRIEEIVHIDTVIVTPLPEASSLKQPGLPLDETPTIDLIEVQRQHKAVEQKTDPRIPEPPGNNGANVAKGTIQRPTDRSRPLTETSSQSLSLRDRITGMLSAIPRPRSSTQPSQGGVNTSTTSTTSSLGNGLVKGSSAFFQRVQRMLIGEQKFTTTAAALIETPLRVQPNQPYTIRIQLMGRDEPSFASTPGTSPLLLETKKYRDGGLSALIEGELVYIEVRSALYESYTYIVQQAAVHIPADGYAADVTMPMHPLASGPGGRRERLHIFFMDEMHHPLYERPFIVELFISRLVQPGREGHNVLTIPL